jgi:hypothetical protein
MTGPRTWLEVEDVTIGQVVLDLQPSVVEVHRAMHGDFRRVHLSQLLLEVDGPDKKGHYDIRFLHWGNQLATYITVDGDGYGLVHPWLEQVLARQAELRS